MKYLSLGLIFSFLCSTSVFASSWMECDYKVKVRSFEEGLIKTRLLKFISGQGMSGQKTRWQCVGVLKGFKIKENKVKKGKDLVKVGAVLKLNKRTYSAMGDKGSVSGVTWKFSKLAKNKAKTKKSQMKAKEDSNQSKEIKTSQNKLKDDKSGSNELTQKANPHKKKEKKFFLRRWLGF